ncbi:nucleoside/nucleotide kinase family protein [Nitratireductor mangrovi]|uniref:Nucleoside/nucleotide kinase family protein n=1 Tax=Nitratireductor mangrovi TaxID=2599600 RepID=A0A5B8KXA8_9HYPH|nr:nucleoside/nucleotide kinase family protein [Nitratireductor mangrovi]QDZ00192.1 nucleoside/nucleotide kinase family protein [Nitratireductor mangrovi]
MSEIAHLAATVFRRAAGRSRFVVGIAGPPGAGKSTLAEALLPLLPDGSAAVVPMDGFHYDNAVLDERGLRARKGAPETFDFDGLHVLLSRLAAGEAEVAVPLFDRAADLARAGAAIIAPAVRFILVEGNYLLLDEAPWTQLAPLLDHTVFLEVDESELERRLVQRWLDHGHDAEAARQRALSNDIPNARRVAERRRTADLVLRL